MIEITSDLYCKVYKILVGIVLSCGLVTPVASFALEVNPRQIDQRAEYITMTS